MKPVIPAPDASQAPIAYPIRTKRCGSWEVFEKRYKPIYPYGQDAPPIIEFYREGNDHMPAWAREDEYLRHVWTVIDCDGHLYLAPGFRFVGFRFVDRFGYILTERPWHEDEEKGMEYKY